MIDHLMLSPCLNGRPDPDTVVHDYAAKAVKTGDHAEVLILPGVSHYDEIAATSQAWKMNLAVIRQMLLIDAEKNSNSCSAKFKDIYMQPVVKIYSELEVFHDKLLDGLEFCRLAYLFFDEVIGQPDGAHRLRERRGAIKPLIEELLPICRYIQTFYGVGNYISVRWIDGNQSFDAKMEAKGNMVNQGDWPSSGTLEVTRAVHKNEHLMRELLNSKGGGFGWMGSRQEREREV